MGASTNTEILKRQPLTGPAFVASCHEGVGSLRWRYLDPTGTGMHAAS
jgi:hypothetical protein